jgi:hypothetical protein
MMENIILSGLSFRNSFGDFHFKQYTTPSPLNKNLISRFEETGEMGKG